VIACRVSVVERPTHGELRDHEHSNEISWSEPNSAKYDRTVTRPCCDAATALQSLEVIYTPQVELHRRPRILDTRMAVLAALDALTQNGGAYVL